MNPDTVLVAVKAVHHDLGILIGTFLIFSFAFYCFCIWVWGKLNDIERKIK